MEFQAGVIEKLDEIYAAFSLRPVRRDDRRRLGLRRSGLGARASRRLRRPGPSDLEGALAPVVRHGDEEWNDIVDWVVYAMMGGGKEKGITRRMVDRWRRARRPTSSACSARRRHGQGVGIDENGPTTRSNWSAIYGEIFDKHLGFGSPLKLERGYNMLWDQGGLIYRMPIR